MINTITPTVVDGELRLFLTVLSGQVLRRAGEAFVFDAESLQLPAKSLLDYNHNDDEIVGYCKDFSIDPKTNAVYCEAALVARPDDPSARVNEVIANIAHGAPYEVSPLIDLSTASRTERLDGASSYHNATLRGVAICPHGTDADTAFVAFTSARALDSSSRPRGGAPSSRYRADCAVVAPVGRSPGLAVLCMELNPEPGLAFRATARFCNRRVRWTLTVLVAHTTKMNSRVRFVL